MSARTPAVRFILLTVLLDVLGIGLVIPVAPRLVESLGGFSASEAAPYVGWLGAIYALCLFVFAPFFGTLSDRFGRRPVILLALTGTGLDYLAQALAPSLWMLFVMRALNGVSGANLAVCNAYIADVTPPEKRAGAYGLIGAAFGLGFVFGPMVGGLLGEIDIRLPFVAAGVLTLVNVLYGVLVLPESLPESRRRRIDLSRANPFTVLLRLTRYRVVARLAAALLLLNVAQFALHATWVLYTAHRYGWDTFQTGLSLTVVGLGAAIVQGGLARKIIPRLGERRSLLAGVAVGVVAYVGYGLATQGWMIYAIVALASLGGIAQPALQAILTKAVPPDEQGELQGAVSGLSSLSTVAGFLLGGYVFEHFTRAGESGPGVYVPGATMFMSAALCAMGLAVAFWALRPGGRGGTASPPPTPDGVADHSPGGA